MLWRNPLGEKSSSYEQEKTIPQILEYTICYIRERLIIPGIRDIEIGIDIFCVSLSFKRIDILTPTKVGTRPPLCMKALSVECCIEYGSG
jgi:hypothetical protein